MTLIDSKAAFRQRCVELSTATTSLFDLLAAQNISSFSELAFACGTPNRAPTDEEFKTLSDSVLGGGATAGQSSLLRRLHFESATLVLSHLKTSVNSETIDGVRKLPFAEKQARYAKVKTAIQGFLIQGETEPSHALVDKCQMMFDTNSVVWLAPSVCTKRELEIQAAPKDNQQVLKIESQTLKVSTEGAMLGDADHSSEIKLQWCWQRRGVALEMCELLSWPISQKWLTSMFAVYASDPPTNFSRVTLSQLISADKALWTILAREIETVKPDATGNRPLDAAVEKLMCDPRVTMHMLSMPHKAPASSSVVSDKSSIGAPTSNANQTGIRPEKKARPGKRNRATPTPPEELKSCYYQNNRRQANLLGLQLEQRMQSGYNGAATKMYQRGPHVLLLQACGALFSDVQGSTGEAKQPLTQDPGKSRITCRSSRCNRFEFNRRAQFR